MRGGPVVAIDGPSGAGKSTVARLLARELALPHLDTGAMYRAVTLAALRAGVDPDDAGACAAVAEGVTIERRGGRTFLDGEDVEDEIRGAEVTAAVSQVAAHPEVRAAMVPVQRAAAVERGGVVEGRDIGSVVFPDADLKVFLTASQTERARRRASEMGTEDLGAVEADIARRDAADTGRTHAPLARPEDAWEIDTTEMSAEEAAEAIAALARTVWARSGRPAAGPTAMPDAPAPVDVASLREARTRIEPREPQPPSDEPSTERAQSAAIAARAQLPRVAVVGRPNVGKSTLVNRVVGQRTAIVEQRPGVTRDRTEHIASWQGYPFLLVDTGGWEHGAAGMAARVVEQAEAAINTADLVLFVVDVTVGVLEDDERYARALRRANVPVLLIANKADSPKQDLESYALYQLGLGDPIAVSAAHGRGVGDLLDLVVAELPDEPVAEPDEGDIPRVAIVGKPNVGKSSLFNRIAGEERSIVDAVPHTTRDAVDTLLEIDGEPWVFVDTAGLRRRYRSGEETELYSADRTRRAIATADLALFVLDASEPISDQDQRLAAEVRDAGCGIVLVLNKWDLVDDDRRAELDRELESKLGFAAWAPRVNVSALTGRSVARLLPRLREAWASYTTRIPTAELNNWLETVTNRTPPPPGKGNRRSRMKYITQVRAAPPTFLLFATAEPPPAYRRYLERELRSSYGFVGSPIVIETRRGGRREES